jgi:hypothetical protein
MFIVYFFNLKLKIDGLAKNPKNAIGLLSLDYNQAVTPLNTAEEVFLRPRQISLSAWPSCPANSHCDYNGHNGQGNGKGWYPLTTHWLSPTMLSLGSDKPL